MPREAKMNQFSSDKPQVFIPPAFEDFRGYLSVPYDRDVPFQVCQINQGYSRDGIYGCGDCIFRWGKHAQAKNGFLPALVRVFNVADGFKTGKMFWVSYSEVYLLKTGK